MCVPIFSICGNMCVCARVCVKVAVYDVVCARMNACVCFHGTHGLLLLSKFHYLALQFVYTVHAYAHTLGREFSSLIIFLLAAN